MADNINNVRAEENQLVALSNEHEKTQKEKLNNTCVNVDRIRGK